MRCGCSQPARRSLQSAPRQSTGATDPRNPQSLDVSARVHLQELIEASDFAPEGSTASSSLTPLVVPKLSVLTRLSSQSNCQRYAHAPNQEPIGHRSCPNRRYHKETGEPRPTQARPIAVRMAADAAAAAASPPAVPSAASAAASAAGTAEASRPTDACRSASAAASPVVSELPAVPATPLSRTPEAPAAPADASDATPDAAASNPPEHAATSADAATAAAPAGAASAAAAPAAAHSGRPASAATAQPAASPAASPASPQPLGAAAAAAPRAAPARSPQTSPQTQLSNGHDAAGAQQTSTAATTMPPSPSTQPVKLARPKTGS